MSAHGLVRFDRLRDRRHRHVDEAAAGRAGLTTVARRARRWTLSGFHASPASDLRVHVLVLAMQVVTLALALHHTVVYRFLANPTPTRFLWPMAWADGLPWRTVALVMSAVGPVVAAAAVIGYRRRSVRVVNAVALVVFVAALSSFGKVNHGLHHVLIPVVAFATVPTLPRALSGEGLPRRAYDRILAGQAVLLLTYTMSGVHKLWAGVEQWQAGQGGLFSTRSLSAIVADRSLQTGDTPPLAGFIVDHPELAAAAFLGTVLIEVLALFTVVVPRLAAVWAVALAGFHLGVFWSMHINFSVSVSVLLVVLGLSPFLARPERAP